MTLSTVSAAAGGTLTDKGVTVTGISRTAGVATLTLSANVVIAANANLAFDGQLTVKNASNTYSLSDAVAQDNLDSTNASQATTAFQNVQAAANSYVVALGTQRSLLGAYQNQMEYTLSNITELSSNLQSARSRVIDTDYASETASLTKGQILQQAATAMLAQANQMPNVILTLLK
jgi:flagellin